MFLNGLVREQRLLTLLNLQEIYWTDVGFTITQNKNIQLVHNVQFILMYNLIYGTQCGFL